MTPKNKIPTLILCLIIWVDENVGGGYSLDSGRERAVKQASKRRVLPTLAHIHDRPQDPPIAGVLQTRSGKRHRRRYSRRYDFCKSERRRCDSHAVCKTFKRFQRCSCREGWEGNGRTCTDINECLLRNGGCVHICINTPGSYNCSCHRGFMPNPLDPHNCQDVDECATDNGGCHHFCSNSIGSYSCICQEGFTVTPDGHTCIASEVCSTLDCEHHCLVSAWGTPSCGCREGHILLRTSRCQPTCSVGNGGCQHYCSDQTSSGPVCTCHSKYLLDAAGQSCAPSCSVNNGGCEKRCHNTATTTRCSCPSGFQLHRNQRSCLDIDECLDQNGNCEHQCINNYGSFECVCPDGFKLMSDDHSCQDVDECSISHTCEHFCTNSVGSYQCQCKEGYDLFAGSHCGDRNECTLNNGGCEQRCVNTDGSFYCTCNADYSLHSNGMDCLQREKCTPLGTPTKAEVSCYHLEDYEYEERCTIKCKFGSTFIMGPNDYYVYTCSRITGFKWMPVYSDEQKGIPDHQDISSIHLACSENQLRSGYRRSALLKYITGPIEDIAKHNAVSQSLLDVLAEKMIQHSENFQLRFISEKQLSMPKRRKLTSENGTIVMTKFDLLNYPQARNRRCRRKCIRRSARKILKKAVAALRKILLEEQVLESVSGQQYKIIPKMFKAQKRMREACPEGFVRVSRKCVACSIGSYHDLRKDACMICPAGTYQAIEGQIDCMSCPQTTSEKTGKQHLKPGARNISECSDSCPAGQWSADGFSPCQMCPPGSYQPFPGRVKCFPCPEGRNSPEGAVSFSQCFEINDLCNSGEYWDIEENLCKACEIGFYQPNKGSNSCLQCPGNSTTDFIRSTSKEQCKRVKCGGYIGEFGGFFESPHYPGDYPNNARCTWVVKPTKGRRILVVIPEIHLSNDQCGDYVILRKNKSPYSTVTYETCSSVYRPMVFTSRSRRLWVHFQSDHNGTNKGFKIHFATYNEEYHKLIESIVRDNRLYSLHSHINIFRNRELLPRLLEVVAKPIKYYEYVHQKHKMFPSSFIRLLTSKVKRFFSYRRRRRK